ncbi:MAG: ATPase, T2SS/T4P/T4SS family [Patescibacteria group bacterium]|jgi:type IV pilus assembly protein PilB
MYKPEELLALLEKKNIITSVKAGEIRTALDKKEIVLEPFLLKNKLVDSEHLVEAKAELYSLGYKNLQAETIKDEALNFLSRDIARNYSVVCFFKDTTVVRIGLVHYDLKAMEAVSFLAKGQNLRVEYSLISDKSFREVLHKYDKLEEEVSTALEVKAKEKGADELITIEDKSEVLKEEDVNSAPVARIVSVIIRHAVESRASDIHIEPFLNESRVRYRIDGILHNSLILPKSIHNSVVARIKVLAKLKLDETRIPQDGHIRLIIDSREIDFRVSTLPLGSIEKVELRILDQAKNLTNLEDLGFNKHVYNVLKESIKKTSGIILMTGPTGSGKTSTLYSIITVLNKETVNISTLEDPIEYQIKGVNQSQIRPELGFDFATGLRSFLRQDPNIIMVGEIRDEETSELAVHAGLTGHLVLSTLHTNDALGSVFRLLDMKVEPFLLASTLRLVVAQRLVRKLCPYCKKEGKLPEKVLSEMVAIMSTLPLETFQAENLNINSFEDIRTSKFYEPVGCTRCSNTGYLDRLAIAEAVVINEEIKDLIINRRNDLNNDSLRHSQLFVSLKQDGIFKVLAGLTSIDEVLRVVEIENL